MAEPNRPPCGTCAGSGRAHGDVCLACGGSGKMLPRRRVPPYVQQPVGWRCPDYPDCAHWDCHEEEDLELAGAPEPTWLADAADAAHNPEK